MSEPAAGYDSRMVANHAPAFVFEPAVESDFDALAALRIEAMRESLERIGRFDPARSTQRLRASFDAARTRHIVVDGVRAGFVIARVDGDAFRIDHLYLRPAVQSKGLGSSVVEALVAEARARALPVRVTALIESRANDFYARNGFDRTGRDGYDVHYRRETTP